MARSIHTLLIVYDTGRTPPVQCFAEPQGALRLIRAHRSSVYMLTHCIRSCTVYAVYNSSHARCTGTSTCSDRMYMFTITHVPPRDANQSIMRTSSPRISPHSCVNLCVVCGYQDVVCPHVPASHERVYQRVVSPRTCTSPPCAHLSTPCMWTNWSCVCLHAPHLQRDTSTWTN